MSDSPHHAGHRCDRCPPYSSRDFTPQPGPPVLPPDHTDAGTARHATSPNKEKPVIVRIFGRLLLAAICVLIAVALVATSNPRAATKPGQRMSSESESLLATVTTTKKVSHIKPLNEIPYRFLAKVADKAIRQGHVYSHRWGDASPWLKAICYEMIDRAFGPYGTAAWARYVVNRESGCNPAAINSSSQTTGIAQIHPAYHTWVDFRRVQRDMAYALRTFLRLSRNGSNTGPWCLC